MLPRQQHGSLSEAAVARSPPIGGLRRERLRRLLKLEEPKVVGANLTPAHELCVAVSESVVAAPPMATTWLVLFVVRTTGRQPVSRTLRRYVSARQFVCVALDEAGAPGPTDPRIVACLQPVFNIRKRLRGILHH